MSKFREARRSESIFSFRLTSIDRTVSLQSHCDPRSPSIKKIVKPIEKVILVEDAGDARKVFIKLFVYAVAKPVVI